LQQLEEWNLAT